MGSANHIDSFHLELPEGWEDRSIHRFVDPEDGGIEHAVTLLVDRYLDTDDVVEYAHDRIDELVEALPNAEILKSEERPCGDGASGYEVVCKWIPADEKITFQKVVYVLRDDVAYTFAANFTKKTWKTLGPQVDRMIDSFRPEKPA